MILQWFIIILPTDPFHRTSTLARLDQNSLTQPARHKSVASSCDNTCTATSGGSVARSGRSCGCIAPGVSRMLEQDLQDACPIVTNATHKTCELKTNTFIRLMSLSWRCVSSLRGKDYACMIRLYLWGGVVCICWRWRNRRSSPSHYLVLWRS